MVVIATIATHDPWAAVMSVGWLTGRPGPEGIRHRAPARVPAHPAPCARTPQRARRPHTASRRCRRGRYNSGIGHSGDGATLRCIHLDHRILATNHGLRTLGADR